MPTIKDIANAVGVSYTTVSNVLNGKNNRVSQATIAKINQAIDELGYVPNMSARSLVSNSSKVIGVINHVVTNKDVNFMEDPFHSVFIGSIEHNLREKGYFLMLRTVESIQDLEYFLRNWNVDGLIFIGMFEDEFFESVYRLNIPLVLIDSYISKHDICCIGLDDFEGGYSAAKYLIEKGHRKIAFASPPIKHKGVVSERYSGFRKALEDNNVDFNENLIFENEFDVDATIHLGKTLASRNDFTAIFATADILAAGIITGLRQEGKHVPEDVSIIGFDNITLGNLIVPTLTTVNQNALLKGKIAADNIVELIETKTVQNPSTTLPTNIIERESVKAI